MAELEEAVYSRVSTFAGFTALAGTRLYPSLAPQTPTYPFAVYQRVTAARTHAMGADTGLAEVLMQLTVWDRTLSGMLALARQVRLALQDWTGTAATVVVQRSFLDNEVDLGFDRTAGAFGRALDFRIWHRE